MPQDRGPSGRVVLTILEGQAFQLSEGRPEDDFWCAVTSPEGTESKLFAVERPKDLHDRCVEPYAGY